MRFAKPKGGADEGKPNMSDAAVTRVSVEIEGKEISFETGKLAKQASGAVVVQSGETMVLCTATAGNLRDVDFLPLTVDVEERMYAAGKIPGSFFKREGRAGEKATLTARMIDRPIRPLFPKGWRRETQLVAMPMSVDHVHPYDILAMNGASAALHDLQHPVPTPSARSASARSTATSSSIPTRRTCSANSCDLDLIVAGTDEAILMVEAGANEIPEAEILDALDIAHDAIKKLVRRSAGAAGEKAGKPKRSRRAARGPRRPAYEQIKASHGEALVDGHQPRTSSSARRRPRRVKAASSRQYSPDPDARDLRRVPSTNAQRASTSSRRP